MSTDIVVCQEVDARVIAARSAYLVELITQLLEQLLQGVDLINADCKRCSHKTRCLISANKDMHMTVQTQRLPAVLITSSQCVSCASCSWLAKLPPSWGFEPMQPIHFCYRIPAVALRKQIAGCFNRVTVNAIVTRRSLGPARRREARSHIKTGNLSVPLRDEVYPAHSLS